MAGGSKRPGASIPKVKTGPSMKFRPPIETGRASYTGTKPLADPSSIQQILVMMIVHLSRKILYTIEIAHRVGLYIFGTFFLSVISDMWGESRSYLSRKDNFFNTYFAKFCWPWTMLVLGAFVFVSAYTTSCGRKPVIKSSLMRLVIATSAWYGFTGLFLMIEDSSGVCNATKFLNKAQCKESGYEWKGLDISGHCFVLVLCNLVILEEAKCYLGWERIKDMLRIEEHKRLSVEIPNDANGNEESTVLSRLNSEEFLHLRSNYRKHTVTIRVLFCLLSLLLVLWDLMIVSTVLYFHLMIEKVVASCLAVVTWFILYRVLYTQNWSPGLPGENGPFRYVTFQSKSYKYPQKRDSMKCNHHDSKGERWSKKDDVPKFMGMPLYALNQNKAAKPEAKAEENMNQGNDSSSTYGKPLRNRSRSSSRIRLFDSKSSLNLRNSTYF